MAGGAGLALSLRLFTRRVLAEEPQSLGTQLARMSTKRHAA